jgi:hypothetical protein
MLLQRLRFSADQIAGKLLANSLLANSLLAS